MTASQYPDSGFSFQVSVSVLKCCIRFSQLGLLELLSSCWIIAFCDLKLLYPLYRNDLDHFLELSAHLIGKLGLHCPGLFLLVSFGAPLLKKVSSRAQHCGRESLIACEKSCQSRRGDTEHPYQI